MNNKVNSTCIHSCNICNKQYSSKSSLCNHNKKYHSEKSPPNPPDNPQFPQNIISNKCKYCNKIFSRSDSLLRHQKICKNRVKSDELNKIKEEKELVALQLELKKEETKILKYKLKLEKSEKKDTVTLKKLNRLLIERNNKIKHINSHNTINSNNQQIINNFQLVGFGKEEILETLTNHEKRLIMNAKYASLEKLIEIVHCGKYSQFKNIILTNIKDNYM